MVKYALILILNIQGMPAAVNVGDYATWQGCMDAAFTIVEDNDMGDGEVHDIKCIKVPQ